MDNEEKKKKKKDSEDNIRSTTIKAPSSFKKEVIRHIQPQSQNGEYYGQYRSNKVIQNPQSFMTKVQTKEDNLLNKYLIQVNQKESNFSVPNIKENLLTIHNLKQYGLKGKKFHHGRIDYFFKFSNIRLNYLPERIKNPLNLFFNKLLKNDNFGFFNSKLKLFSCSSFFIKYLIRNSYPKLSSLLSKKGLVKEVHALSKSKNNNLNFLQELILSAKKVEDYVLRYNISKEKRHDILESMILINNKYCLAIEIPVWDKALLITGHIDFILFSIVNNKIYIIIVDYKPNVESGKEYYLSKYIPQVSMYSFLLMKRLDFIKDVEFRCFIFNRNKGILFNPSICFTKIPQIIDSFYEKRFFLPSNNLLEDLKEDERMFWMQLMNLETLHKNINKFTLSFVYEMKIILNFEGTPTFSSIYKTLIGLINKFKNLNLNSKQIHNLNTLLQKSLLLLKIERKHTGKILNLLKFCSKFRLDFNLFKDYFDSEIIKTLYNIQRFCLLFTPHSERATELLDDRIKDKIKIYIENLATTDESSVEACSKLSITHNTLNHIISELWEDYNVSNFTELKQLFRYLEIDKDFFISLLNTGYSFLEIEKEFIKRYLREDLKSVDIGEELNINEKTVRRKVKNLFDDKTIEEVKHELIPDKYSSIKEENDYLKEEIKKRMLEFEPVEKIRNDLNLGYFKFYNLVNQIFSLDLSPDEVLVYLALKNIDEDLLNQLWEKNIFEIKEIRMIFFENLLRKGIPKDIIAKQIRLSERQIDHLIKKWYENETFTSLKDKLVFIDFNLEDYIIYKNILIKRSLQDTTSERDLSILENFSKFNSGYYTLLSSKGLSVKEMKKRFILLLISEDLDSSSVAEQYGFQNRSSLRYEIHKIFNKNTTFSILKEFSFKQKKKDLKLLHKTEALILDFTIREISKKLDISTWKIDSLIKRYKKGLSFGQFKIYLACKKVDSDLLSKLESQEYSFNEIIAVYVKKLKEKGYNISKISDLMIIPITQLKKIFNELIV